MIPYVVAGALLVTAGSASVTVAGSTITVHVTVVPADTNLGVEVAMTALDTVPPDWAQATVFHQWILDAETAQFDDVWNRMPPGQYQVHVTLWQENGAQVLWVGTVIVA